MEMRKILIIDDEYPSVVDELGGELRSAGELIPVDTALTWRVALRTIRAHPEADLILLDGDFGPGGTCLDVIRHLTEEEKARVVCFSSEPEMWLRNLSARGICHFPGKVPERVLACTEGRCTCAELIAQLNW